MTPSLAGATDAQGNLEAFPGRAVTGVGLRLTRLKLGTRVSKKRWP